jgi:3-hydroxyacyl-[acyl-carrier-protein] dehydratase
MYFMSIDKAKFRRAARPGDMLEYHVDKVAQRHNMWWYRGERATQTKSADTARRRMAS